MQNWLCISKGSGSCLSVLLPKLAEEAGALAQEGDAIETLSRNRAELSVLGRSAAGNLHPERGRKQRSKIYKAEFINLLTCFSVWDLFLTPKLLFLCTG